MICVSWEVLYVFVGKIPSSSTLLATPKGVVSIRFTVPHLEAAKVFTMSSWEATGKRSSSTFDIRGSLVQAEPQGR